MLRISKSRQYTLIPFFSNEVMDTRVWFMSAEDTSLLRVSEICLKPSTIVLLLILSTRKPCYRKDDRVMRPIYGCPEKFRESSQTPLATFPEICKGLLFRSILRMCIQNLKFVALSVPKIIGATQKSWAVPVYAHVPVSPKFLIGFCSYGPSEYICQI